MNFRWGFLTFTCFNRIISRPSFSIKTSSKERIATRKGWVHFLTTREG